MRKILMGLLLFLLSSPSFAATHWQGVEDGTQLGRFGGEVCGIITKGVRKYYSKQSQIPIKTVYYNFGQKDAQDVYVFERTPYGDDEIVFVNSDILGDRISIFLDESGAPIFMQIEIKGSRTINCINMKPL